MKADNRFLNMPKSFWASARSLSQEIGYAKRNKILIPSYTEMVTAFKNLNLDPNQLINQQKETALARQLYDYFKYRSHILTKIAEPNLMEAEEAKKIFDGLKNKLNPRCPLPMNKQKGDKKAYAYFTGIINMLIEKHSDGITCDYDPRKLTTVTFNNAPLRTLSRRVDGAFSDTVNPIAIWEIKEYYYTTTFGSRIADGVYETLLDGLELEELREHESIDVKHYLMVDAYNTWWKDGKSYLCRMVDMLHMGYVDEILFGKEVINELPRIVSEWVKIYQQTPLSER